jgi:DNA-binding transcriptional ArsR family regulator
MNETHNLARFFKALGDETRLRLVALLARQEPGNALCVGRLARELETTTSNVSQHLRVLKDLGLVRGERRGYHIHYFLDQGRLAAYGGTVRELLGTDLFGDPSGEEVSAMRRDETCACTHPGKKRDPQECTPEHIRECHGEGAEEHPCESGHKQHPQVEA